MQYQIHKIAILYVILFYFRVFWSQSVDRIRLRTHTVQVIGRDKSVGVAQARYITLAYRTHVQPPLDIGISMVRVF